MSKVKPSSTISAVVTRVDGTQVNLGVLADSRWGRFSVQKWLSNRRIRKLNGN